MLPGLHMIMVTAKARQDDLLREAERERLVTVARATVTAERNRRYLPWRRADDRTPPIPAPRLRVQEPTV